MLREMTYQFLFRLLFYAVTLTSLIACTPATTPEPQRSEPITPTPEIFSALAPSPTPPIAACP